MGDSYTHENLETVLQNYPNLECEQLTEQDFERIGDAVMEQNHPGEAHQAMDQMMSGEGSENLEQMHINMGKSYLNCQGNLDYSGNRDEVMNMGYMPMQMGGTGFGGLWLVNSLLVSVLLIVLIRYFWKKGGDN